MPLVEIRADSHDVAIDLRYATADNITGRPLYARSICLLHADAAAALVQARNRAAAIGLRLCLFDAYRPVEAQWALWQTLPDPRFIADPRQGSNHNRGVAVDLTLLAADGGPLDMGTGFDDMTEASHHASTAVGHEARRNRLVLAGVMAVAGFEPYPFEWWHYQLPDATRYPMIDQATLGCGPIAAA
jgi:D-alanyl-D-alanine dipeptidase